MTNRTEALRERIQHALMETDVRELRRRLTRAAHTGSGLLGDDLAFDGTAAMIRRTWQQADHEGMSGEDVYTLMAYRLAVLAEERSALLQDLSFTTIRKDAIR